MRAFFLFFRGGKQRPARKEQTKKAPGQSGAGVDRQGIKVCAAQGGRHRLWYQSQTASQILLALSSDTREAYFGSSSPSNSMAMQPS